MRELRQNMDGNGDAALQEHCSEGREDAGEPVNNAEGRVSSGKGKYAYPRHVDCEDRLQGGRAIARPNFQLADTSAVAPDGGFKSVVLASEESAQMNGCA